MNTGRHGREELQEGLATLHLLLAGVEAELRALDAQEAAIEAREEVITQKESVVVPLEDHNRSLQRMVHELEEATGSVEGKMASMRAKEKLIGCLEGVVRARKGRLDRKEEDIMTRLAGLLKDMERFEPLCPVSEWSGECVGELVEVREGARGRWVEVGSSVFYVHDESGEMWMRLR